MQSVNSTELASASTNEYSISLTEVFSFIVHWWKVIALTSAVGLLFGLGGWATFVAYKAESILINNGAINFLSWRGLQKSLPILASQMLETDRVAPTDVEQYKRLANPAWWQKNVRPTYSLTKSDTKDLANISKELQESGGTNILNLVVTASGASKESAETNVSIATSFIKQGSAYLLVKNLVNGYESQVLNTEAELQMKMSNAEVDLKLMRERARNLETLRQRFPANVAVGTQQIVDLKDSNAKFMPISTQLVAINTDINNTVESLQLMQNRLAQSKVLREFLDQATIVVSKQSNGITVVNELLKIEAKMRSDLEEHNVNAYQMLNGIQATLVGMRTGFTKDLDADFVPQVSKPGPLQPAALGIFGGAFTGLLFALTCNFLAKLKQRAVVAQ